MILFRPHIAFIAIVSLALALSLETKYAILPRFLFLFVAGIGSIFVVQAVSTTLNVNVADPNSVSDFLYRTQSVNATIVGTTSVNGPFPVRLFSLLFRPMFIDAHGIFGIIGSFENLFFLASFIALVRNLSVIKYFFKFNLYWKYVCIFTTILTISLAEVYYNVGLGLRERVMVYPALLPVLLVALAAAGAQVARRRSPRSSAGLSMASEARRAIPADPTPSESTQS